MATTRADSSALLDQLKDRIGQVEEVLANRFNIRAEVPMSDGRSLAFGKLHDKWQLSVIVTESEYPLISVPIKVRLEAVRLLPQLTEALEVVQAKVAEEVERAIEIVDAWLDKEEEEK